MCLTTVILAPGASEGGLGVAGQVSLQQDPGDWLNNSSRPLFVRRLRTWEPFAENWTSNLIRNLLNVLRHTKATSMSSQGVLKWSKGCRKEPKKSPKSAQGKKKSVEGHPKEANKSHNYIHMNKMYTNSRSTAIQRPASIIYTMQHGKQNRFMS